MKIKVIVLTCPHCKDEIFSKHRHDYCTCRCGKYSIDGGRDYTKVSGENAIEYLSEKEIENETKRPNKT
jgi:hypothetical protein